MSSAHTRILDIPSLPQEVCIQYLFPQMTTTGLLSIGKLCDHGCTATFSEKQLIIQNKEGVIIIVGHRRGHNTMWLVQLEADQPITDKTHACNAIVLSETTKKDLAKFHHASLGFPIKPPC